MSETTFFWNGRRMTGRAGDTIAEALHRNGVQVLAFSRKHHRPLGHSGSYAAGVQARVDGRPNTRLDLEPLTEGARVEMQNTWPAPGLDLLSLARFIPAPWLRGGFEHGRLAPSGGKAFLLWERLLAWLAGVATPPPPELAAAARPARRVDLDVLVIGGGPAGIAEANAAAARGLGVGLVTRGEGLARYAGAMGTDPGQPVPEVTVFNGIEMFGAYRDGRLLAGAPHQHDQGAVLFHAAEVVLATGRQSIPPLVPGSHLPGVMAARGALVMAARTGLMPGQAIAVFGSGDETRVAERLRQLGGSVIHAGSVADLARIRGLARVTGVTLSEGGKIACDAVVHAGPWQADHGLIFQARAEGGLQLMDRPGTSALRLAGSAATPDDAIHVPRNISPKVVICPCMDVNAGELLSHIDAGEHDPEVLKRLTSCGMGPCQGWPCWNGMLALLAARSGRDLADFRRPSARAPRGALTLAQAAGLWDVVEVET